MNPASARAWRGAVAAGVGGVLVLAAAGFVQPSQPAGGAWEYAALTRSERTGYDFAAMEQPQWRFCGPGVEDTTLLNEDEMILALGAADAANQPAVALVNTVAGRGWELVSHTQSGGVVGRVVNGATDDERGMTVDQWWFRRARHR